MSFSSSKNIIQKSVLTDTKEKFDNILKDALKDSPHASKKTYEEQEKSNDLYPVYSFNNPSDEEKREFILNKFFESNTLNKEEERPIPKPRTKLKSNNDKNSTLSPNSSNETFKVTDPNQSKRSSISSTNTYKVSSPKVVCTVNDELSSEKTFKIYKDAPKVGDIIIHGEGSNPKIVDVEVKNEVNSESSKEKSEMREIENGSVKNQEINETEQKRNLLNVTIHKTDKLLLNSLVIHPVVKICVVDIHTGNYFLKNEERNDELKYLTPIMTKPFNLQEKRSLKPEWEETVLINEEYDYVVQQKANVIFFFEILDFVPVYLINNKEKEWHQIAFAFLKVGGKNEALNLRKNMRLQLYYFSYKKDDGKKCSLWEFWKKGKFRKYPSSLYVSIWKTENGEGLSRSPPYSNEIEKEMIQHSKKEWKRNDGEKTKLPNRLITEFETDIEGCFTIAFSHTGSYLACAFKQNNIFSIVIFSLDTFEQVHNLPGHQDLIYSIRWSSDDSMIIASSADCTVSIWNLKQVSFLQILPHPKFVYTCEIGKDIIITGCYDSKLRIWNKDLTLKYLLYQELQGHAGFYGCDHRMVQTEKYVDLSQKN